MTSTGAAAYGIFSRNVALADVVHTLNRAGFQNEDICMVLSPLHPVATVVRDANILNAGREASARSAGLIGWFSEFGAVVIPTIGFFIRSHWFFRALVTEPKTSALCGGSATLTGLGFSEDDANRLGRQLSDVGVLVVYVSCQENTKADSAIELLRRTGAGEVASMGKTGIAEVAA